MSDKHTFTEMTPAIREVLGLMVFRTCPMAHAFRAAGHDIPNKTEDEQAFVLHRFLGYAIEHGDKWREVAGKDLEDAIAVAKEAAAKAGDAMVKAPAAKQTP